VRGGGILVIMSITVGSITAKSLLRALRIDILNPD